MKKITCLILICTLIFGVQNVNAQQITTLDKDIIVQIKEQLDYLDISNNTQKLLVEKLLNGQAWDCMLEEKIDAIQSEEIMPTFDCPVKRVTFEDGSVLEYRMILPTIKMDTNTLDLGIESIMRSYFNNVQISIKNGLSGGGFFADYFIDWNDSSDSITAVRDPYCNVIAGNYKDLSVVLNRSSSFGQPAEATYSANITYIGGVGGAETLIIKMYVGNDQMVFGKPGSVSIPY